MKKKIFCSYALLLALCAIIVTGCANEKNFQKAKVVEKTTIVPGNTKATVLSLTSQVKNGGKIGILSVTGNGAMEASSVDATTGEVSVQPYTILSEGAASATLDQDTTWVDEDELGVVEIVGYPETTTKDITSDEKIGLETTMATWKFSDGQSATGLMSWAYTKAQTTAELPHLVIENLCFNKVVSVEVLSEHHACVTLSFLVDVKGVNANAVTGAGEQEIRVSYIQAVPEPELKYSLDLAFSTQGTNLVAELTINSSKGEKWSNPWYASQIGKYNDLKTLYVSSTEVVDKIQNIEDDATKEKKISFEQDGAHWEMSTICKKVTDSRFWLSDANGKVGPEMTVFFYTTSVEFSAPTGEKIRVIINQETDFEENGFSTVESLVGDVKTLPNETTEYVYNKSYTYSANHYVHCTLVDVDGTEKSYPISCISDGLFRHNVCTTNLYHTK